MAGGDACVALVLVLCALSPSSPGDASVPSPHNPSPAPTGTKPLPKRCHHIPATVLAVNRGLLPAGQPRVSGRWPARSASPRLLALPTSAGRAGGSADWLQELPPAGALLLSPGSHPLHAVRPPFHNESRNPSG